MPFLLALRGWRVPGPSAADARRLLPSSPRLAAVTRPDGVQVIAVVLATMAVRGRRWPWREGVLAVAVLLPFLALAWHAYGSPLPSTLPAKLAQRDSGLWAPLAAASSTGCACSCGTPRARTSASRRWRRRPCGCGSPPASPAIWRLRPLLPLAGVDRDVHRAAYALLRVPFYHWYAAPAALGLCILGGAGLARAIEWLVSTVAVLRCRAMAGGDRGRDRRGARDLAAAPRGAAADVAPQRQRPPLHRGRPLAGGADAAAQPRRLLRDWLHRLLRRSADGRRARPDRSVDRAGGPRRAISAVRSARRVPTTSWRSPAPA